MSAVERMRADLRYADSYRDRARALDGLGMLLECETPGTVSEVSVKGGRWFRRMFGRDQKGEKQEIILSDDERREFADWCQERAATLRKQADDIETRLTTKESE